MRHSNSALDVYRSCPLKYALRYVHGLAPLQPVSKHDMDYGKAMHEGLAVLYGPNGSVKAARAAFAESLPPADYPPELPAWSQGKTFQNGCAALSAYAQRWRDEDSNWKVVEVETMQTVNDQTETNRVVRLDLIVEDQRDGQVYAIDHKVTGKYLDSNYWTTFEPHSQIRSYVAHVKERYGHCGGFYINAISLKHRSRAYTPRKGPQKGVQLPAGDWFDFARMCFNPNTECLELEANNLAYWTARVETDMAADSYGYNTQECHRGGSVCEYHRICSAGYSWPRDEELILNYYRQTCREVMADEGRCQLDRGHEGEHSSIPPLTEAATDYMIDADELEMEDAVVD